MRRLLFLVTLICCLFTLKAAADVVRVGLILPLSGEAADWGEGIRNGVELFFSELGPEEQKRIKLIFEDDQIDPKKTVVAFKKLTEVDHVHVVVGMSSGPGFAIAPLADENKIPFISVSSDSRVTDGKQYAVGLWVSADEMGRRAYREAWNRGYRRIARIISDEHNALAISKGFDAENNGNLKLLLDEIYPQDIKDFKPYISKLRTRGQIDALAVALAPGQLGIFTKQARELGIKAPFFGFAPFENPTERSISAGALVGQWYVTAANADQKFIEDYLKRYPNAPLLGAANGHDALKLIVSATADETSREKINQYLHNVKGFTGALGTFSANGDNRFSLKPSVKVVTENGFKELYK